MNINLINYREDFYGLYNFLEKEIELTPYQKEKLRELHTYNNIPFLICKRIEVKKPKLLWRLTFPFYLIAYCLVFILCCLKWVFTGDLYLGSSKHPIYRFMKAWHNKIYLNNPY